MLHLDADDDAPLYLQLYEQIRRDILSGALANGERLMSVRALAKELQISRNTVEGAYAQLVLEGYASASPRSGHVVSASGGELAPETQKQDGAGARAALKKKAAAKPYLYDFHYGSLDASAFPRRIWRKLAISVLDAAERSPRGENGMRDNPDPKGDISLRQELAAYLYRSRGVRCEPGQVVVCSGLQPALLAILRLFPFEEKIVAMEEPGYGGARVVYEAEGFEVLPVLVTADGVDAASLAAASVRMAYIAPSHQFPTGAVMPIQKRMEILQWAAARDALIIEDDYDSEFRYNGKPIPSLQSIDRQGRVIYLGTFSKALSPGMRMGYMVLPDWLSEKFDAVFAGFKCTAPWFEQKMLSRFIGEGHWERHLRKMRLLTMKRHDALIDAVARHFGDRARLWGQGGGLHVLLEFPGGETERDLVDRAAAFGVRVYPAAPFWMDKSRYGNNCLLLGYGAMPEADIERAVEILRRAWFD